MWGYKLNAQILVYEAGRDILSILVRGKERKIGVSTGRFNRLTMRRGWSSHQMHFISSMVWKVRIQADSEKDWGKHDI